MGKGNVPFGENELDRLLQTTFPSLSGSGLGDTPYAENPSRAGLAPGTTYQGGPQTQAKGQGRRAQVLKRKLGKLFDGIDLEKCGPLASPDCVELLSRLLEQTFRNFIGHSARPAWVDPPYIGRPTDGSLGVVTVAVGVFTPLATVVIPPGAKGEIVEIGTGIINPGNPTYIDSGIARDLIFSLQVDGAPFAPWGLMTGFQPWSWPTPTRLPQAIHLRGEQTITIGATAIVAPHDCVARLGGWIYTPRVDTGDEARSTITD